MANSSIYMSFEGVDGSATVPEGISNAPAGGKWIGLTSCTLSGNNRGSFTGAVTALEGVPIVVTKLMDSASVLLLDAFLRNRPAKSVVISHARVNDGGTGVTEFLRYELTKAQIIEFGHVGGDGPPTERLAIFYGSLEITSWDYDQTSQQAPASVVIENQV